MRSAIWVATLAGAGFAVAVLGGPAPAEEKAGFSFNDKAGEYLDVLCGGKPVARYVYAYDQSTPARRGETCKPFLHVFDAEGKGIITNGPSGNWPEKVLYPHHRGIFIGWQKIGLGGKVHNFWEMRDGVQVHQKFLEQTAGPDEARFTSQVAWDLADGKTVLQEERTITVRRCLAPALALVDFASSLRPVAGDLLLDGDPEHGGVQYRPANDLDKTETKYCLPKQVVDSHLDANIEWQAMRYPEAGKTDKDGKPLVVEIKKIEKTDLAWAAMSYVLGGRRYAVQEMSHPDNPKGTVWSAYRDYGRFGAFFKGEVRSGQTLTIRYRFIVTEGNLPTRDELEKAWQTFVDSAKK